MESTSYYRQLHRKRAPLPWRAHEANFAAQQAGQLTADRQPQASAAVLAARAAVGLLERLEDDLLLVRRDTDAGIRHGDRHHRGSAVQVVVVVAPTILGGFHGQGDLAVMRELERVG